MHDLRMLRDQIDVLREGLRRRGALEGLAPVLERAEGLEQQRRLLIVAADERKAARNTNAQEVARRKKAGEAARAGLSRTEYLIIARTWEV